MPATLVRREQALVSNVEFIDNQDARPVHLSADGVTSYFVRQKQLFTSVDDGTLQGPWWTLPVSGTSTGIVGVDETADGELLATCFKQQGNYAGIWRSTGWANRAVVAPTFTEVLTPAGQAPFQADPATFPSPMGSTGSRSNYFSARFGFHCYPNGTVVANEYGIQSNGTSISGARYGVVSNDNGKPGTWRVVFDLFTGPAYGVGWAPGTLPFGAAGQHSHGMALDPYTDRMWASAGDHGSHTRYSDDWRRVFNGEYATWTVHPGSSNEFGGIGNVAPVMPGTTQSVQPFAFPDRVVLTTDGQIDGITKIEKDDPDFLREAHGLGLPHSTSLKYTGSRIYQRTKTHPVLFPQYIGSGTGLSLPAIIVASDPLGERFYDVWTDSQSLANPYGVYSAVGPTARGKLLASIALDGRSAGQVSDQAGYTFMRADFPVIV